MDAAIADALNDALQPDRVVGIHGHVIEEKEGFGARADDVVDAHGDQVDADRVVDARRLGDFEFRADAVGSRNENRVAVASREEGIVVEIELKEAGKAALGRQDSSRIGAPHPPRQPAHRLLVAL